MPTLEQLAIGFFGVVLTSMLAVNTFFLKRLIANVDINTRITNFLKTEVAVIKAVLKIKSPNLCDDEGKS